MNRKLIPICWLSLLTLQVPSISAQARQAERQLSLAEALNIAEKESETVGVARAGIEAAIWRLFLLITSWKSKIY